MSKAYLGCFFFETQLVFLAVAFVMYIVCYCLRHFPLLYEVCSYGKYRATINALLCPDQLSSIYILRYNKVAKMIGLEFQVFTDCIHLHLSNLLS